MTRPTMKPNEWQAITWSCHARTTIAVDDPSVVTGIRVIAECETEADARLIAAAPELLAALKSLIRAGHTLNSSSIQWNSVHAAMAKATGVPA